MKYEGACHCGRVAFDVETDAPITQVMECNCSMCSRRGHLLAFVPAAQVHLHTAESDVSSYTFNKHVIQHQFCPVCGVPTFCRGTDPQGNAIFGINVRCLDGVDPHALQVKAVDGRSF